MGPVAWLTSIAWLSREAVLPSCRECEIHDHERGVPLTIAVMATLGEVGCVKPRRIRETPRVRIRVGKAGTHDIPFFLFFGERIRLVERPYFASGWINILRGYLSCLTQQHWLKEKSLFFLKLSYLFVVPSLFLDFSPRQRIYNMRAVLEKGSEHAMEVHICQVVSCGVDSKWHVDLILRWGKKKDEWNMCHLRKGHNSAWDLRNNDGEGRNVKKGRRKSVKVNEKEKKRKRRKKPEYGLADSGSAQSPWESPEVGIIVYLEERRRN